jgi:hypothetical protein
MSSSNPPDDHYSIASYLLQPHGGCPGYRNPGPSFLFHTPTYYTTFDSLDSAFNISTPNTSTEASIPTLEQMNPSVRDVTPELSINTAKLATPEERNEEDDSDIEMEDSIQQ